ncbi:MAG TPA: hypothetical protein VF892_14585, partial [Pseudonocardiaceae bacterium]
MLESTAIATGAPALCCPALKMPMGAALWMPMVWGEKPRRVLPRRGFVGQVPVVVGMVPVVV